MHSRMLVPVAAAALSLLAACGGTDASARSADTSAPRAAGTPTAAALTDSAGKIAEHLMKFDTLDFDAFSHQKFERFAESHAQDIIVTWPDGHETKGLARHLEDMKGMFVALPDLQVTAHPIKIANGSWTAVQGHMAGTFSKPMPLGGGKFAQPTGKKLDLTMVTIGHWTDAGVMDHEWLYWDNAAFMSQLGLAK
jgi:predicted ester cyclase